MHKTCIDLDRDHNIQAPHQGHQSFLHLKRSKAKPKHFISNCTLSLEHRLGLLCFQHYVCPPPGRHSKPNSSGLQNILQKNKAVMANDVVLQDWPVNGKRVPSNSQVKDFPCPLSPLLFLF